MGMPLLFGGNVLGIPRCVWDWTMEIERAFRLDLREDS
jgi:hypothetical protein